MKFLLSLFLVVSMVACSGSKSENSIEGDEAGSVMADGEDFSDEFSDGSFDELVEEGAEDPALVDDQLPGEELKEAPPPVAIADSGMSKQYPAADSGVRGQYSVAKNETLMLIAFKLYGDYEKWRELASLNSDKLDSSYTLREGMVLTYNEPVEKFVWNPEGNPYLIKRGDTLGTISNDVYGVNKYWRDIWNNNKPLIKDPNVIFAGFTIYTPIIETRDLANSNI